MKSLRLLILFLCGYLLITGLGFLFPKGEYHGTYPGSNFSRSVLVFNSAGNDMRPLIADHTTPFPPWTPPRYQQRYSAWCAAHPRIRRIVEWRVYDEHWRQVGVVYKGEIFDLEGRRRGCLYVHLLYYPQNPEHSRNAQRFTSQQIRIISRVFFINMISTESMDAGQPGRMRWRTVLPR